MLHMDIDKGIKTTAYINVLVESHGDISAFLFHKYYELIKQSFEQVPIFKITRFTKENEKSPFINQNYRTSEILLRYTLNPDTFKDENQKRKFHAYIGITTCKNNIPEVHKTFQKRVNEVKCVNIRRLFAVEYDSENRKIEYSSNEEEMEIVKDLIILLPSDDQEKLKFYVERPICDLVNSLLKSFEKVVCHPESFINILDLKKRVNKMKEFADYSMLCGDLYDSIESYKKVIKGTNEKDLSKFYSKENLVTCLYLQSLRNENNDKKDVFDFNSIFTNSHLEKMYFEIVVFYEKNNMIFPKLIQSYLRIAVEYSNCEIIEGEVYGKIINYLEKIISLTINKKLSSVEKIVVYEKCQYLYEKINCSRKSGLMFLKMSKLLHELEDFDKSTEFAFRALKYYHIPIKIQSGITIGGEKWLVDDREIGKGWKEIQCFILKEVIKYSSNNYFYYGRLIFYILSHYFENLTTIEQEDYFNELDNLFILNTNIPKNLNFCSTEFPILFSIKPLELLEKDKPYKNNESKPNENEIFLVVPNIYKDKIENNSIIEWVKNESCEIEVILFNPFEIEIFIRSIDLKVNLDCLIYTTGNIIKSKSLLTLKIFLIPREIGNLVIGNISIYVNKISNKITIPLESMITINVIDQIPLILAHFLIPSLTVYEREEIVNKLILENISSTTVNILSISFKGDNKNCINFNEKDIKLPFEENSRLIIPLYIYIPSKHEDEGKYIQMKEFLCEIIYSQKIWFRKCIVKLKIKCSKGLRIQSENDIIKVYNPSTESFYVALKNGKTISIPPNYTKILFQQNIKSWKSTHNLIIKLKKEDTHHHEGNYLLIQFSNQQNIKIYEKVLFNVVVKKKNMKLKIDILPAKCLYSGKLLVTSIPQDDFENQLILRFLEKGEQYIKIQLFNDCNVMVDLKFQKFIVVNNV